ncbi:TPA: hypothetical protein ACGQ50_000828 [Enterobacter cloacae]
MAEKKVGFSLDALNASSPSGSRFAGDYGQLTGHLAKRVKIFNALRVGQLVEEAEITAILALLDNPNWTAASPAQRRAMLINGISLLVGGDTIPAAAAAPQAPVQQPQPEETPAPAPAETKQPAPVVKAADDGSITVTETAAEARPKLPGLKGLGN